MLHDSEELLTYLFQSYEWQIELEKIIIWLINLKKHSDYHHKKRSEKFKATE